MIPTSMDAPQVDVRLPQMIGVDTVAPTPVILTSSSTSSSSSSSSSSEDELTSLLSKKKTTETCSAHLPASTSSVKCQAMSAMSAEQSQGKHVGGSIFKSSTFVEKMQRRRERRERQERRLLSQLPGDLSDGEIQRIVALSRHRYHHHSGEDQRLSSCSENISVGGGLGQGPRDCRERGQLNQKDQPKRSRKRENLDRRSRTNSRSMEPNRSIERAKSSDRQERDSDEAAERRKERHERKQRRTEKAAQKRQKIARRLLASHKSHLSALVVEALSTIQDDGEQHPLDAEKKEIHGPNKIATISMASSENQHYSDPSHSGHAHPWTGDHTKAPSGCESGLESDGHYTTSRVSGVLSQDSSDYEWGHTFEDVWSNAKMIAKEFISSSSESERNDNVTGSGKEREKYKESKRRIEERTNTRPNARRRRELREARARELRDSQGLEVPRIDDDYSSLLSKQVLDSSGKRVWRQASPTSVPCQDPDNRVSFELHLSKEDERSSETFVQIVEQNPNLDSLEKSASSSDSADSLQKQRKLGTSTTGGLERHMLERSQHSPIIQQNLKYEPVHYISTPDADSSKIETKDQNKIISRTKIKEQRAKQKQRELKRQKRRFCLEWDDLSFISNPDTLSEKRILDSCYGRLHPGQVCALIGPSGAGKSTLMNLLAGRQDWGDERYRTEIAVEKTLTEMNTERNRNSFGVKQDSVVNNTQTSIESPKSCSHSEQVRRKSVVRTKANARANVRMTGTIKYGGIECTFEELRTSIGYVMQEDNLPAYETVEEALTFAALLKLEEDATKNKLTRSNRSRSYRDNIKERVDLLLRTLGLTDCKDVLIGDKLMKGISGGQKKRVSAGIELISSPDILFLDEPTSGLDSFSSLALIKALKNIAEVQQTIICATIHQPSPELFSLFDQVICLRSGNVLFSGALQGNVVNLDALSAQLKQECPLLPTLCFADSESNSDSKSSLSSRSGPSADDQQSDTTDMPRKRTRFAKHRKTGRERRATELLQKSEENYTGPLSDEEGPTRGRRRSLPRTRYDEDAEVGNKSSSSEGPRCRQRINSVDYIARSDHELVSSEVERLERRSEGGLRDPVCITPRDKEQFRAARRRWRSRNRSVASLARSVSTHSNPAFTTVTPAKQLTKLLTNIKPAPLLPATVGVSASSISGQLTNGLPALPFMGSQTHAKNAFTKQVPLGNVAKPTLLYPDAVGQTDSAMHPTNHGLVAGIANSSTPSHTSVVNETTIEIYSQPIDGLGRRLSIVEDQNGSPCIKNVVAGDSNTVTTIMKIEAGPNETADISSCLIASLSEENSQVRGQELEKWMNINDQRNLHSSTIREQDKRQLAAHSCKQHQIVSSTISGEHSESPTTASGSSTISDLESVSDFDGNDAETDEMDFHTLKLCSIPNILFHIDQPQPELNIEDFFRKRFEINTFSTNMADWILYLAQTMNPAELDQAANLTRSLYDIDSALLRVNWQDSVESQSITTMGTDFSSEGEIDGVKHSRAIEEKEFTVINMDTECSDELKSLDHTGDECVVANGAKKKTTFSLDVFDSISEKSLNRKGAAFPASLPRKILRNGDEAIDRLESDRLQTDDNNMTQSSINPESKAPVLVEDQLQLKPSKLKGFWVQTLLLTHREFLQVSRRRSRLYVRLGIPFLQMACYALVYMCCALNLTKGRDNRGQLIVHDYQWSEKLDLTYGAISNMHFVLMVAAAQQNIQNIPDERPVFLREYSSNFYSVPAYLMSKFVVEIPILLIHSLTLFTLLYFAYGLQGDFLQLWFIGFLITLAGSSVGTFLSCLGASGYGLILAPLVLDTFPECFSGVLQGLEEITPWFRWMSYFAPHSYAADVSGNVEFSWMLALQSVRDALEATFEIQGMLVTDVNGTPVVPPENATILRYNEPIGKRILAWVACGNAGEDRHVDTLVPLGSRSSKWYHLSYEQLLNLGTAYEEAGYQSTWDTKFKLILLDDRPEFDFGIPQYISHASALFLIFVVCRLVACWNLTRTSRSLY